ncbi:GATA zinc finger domain-containing protein 10 [Frieseomelitta varia]|uniref:GATA zinc finger domain-containing protein 10 n=1 Tax=Frieseomelitta varia TaxID=561572 RepID=UPI001CB6AB23|nr:GATA zinc finger domain-containing protein 10 [Frieseomelitta varia]
MSIEQQQQQQQYVASSSNLENYCKNCDVYFESDKSLDVHLRYHHENLLSQWASEAQQEESNNNNSKAGNHNSHVGVKRDSVTAPADSSETILKQPLHDPTSLSQKPSTQQQQQQQPSQQQQQAQQQQQQPGAAETYNQFQPSMFSETNYVMQNDQAYMMPHHYSPPREDNGGGSYSRYHPYQHQQHFVPDHTSSVSSTSPSSPPLQCDKCGAVYENANQLGEHVRANHSNSPSGYPGQHQYQQLGSSPQQQNQQQQQQMHPSPPQSSQQQQQPGYDYNGGQPVEIEAKQEPDEQAEILDLDSHKVQTHRYEEELMRLHHQQHHELHMQMHQQQVMQHQQQQRVGTHSVSAMLGWPPGAQPHDYHPGLSPMGPLDSVSSLSDQAQFMRGQHMPVEPQRHPGSPIITSTQPIPVHQMPGGLLQQPPKPPPLANQSWKSNEARRPKTYNCTACNKWFTSSGHLKRHYNTTLHKNAVKQSNQPDPANLPISAHHHPGRESHSGGRGGGPSRSPELPSSGSPPNLMAGPSGEAARGLLHTPTTVYNSNSNNNNNSNNSNSSSSSESSAVTAALTQPSPTAVHLASTMVPPLNSPVESPLAGHHQHQMGSSPPQLGHQHQHQHQHQQQQQQQPQQQQQLHQLSMGSPSGQLHVHPMNSPMHPPPAPHLNSPTSMGPSHPHHHMNSPSAITPSSVHPAMASPTAMGGTTMPHQPYPNALPPHVIPTTNIPGLLESFTIQLTTTGNEMSFSLTGQSQHQQQLHHHDQQQQQQQQHQQQQQQEQQQQQQQQQLQCLDVLPGFGTFSNHHQRSLPCFTQFNVAGFLIGQNQLQAVNVGGLSPEENVSPQNRSFESTGSNYDPYSNSPPQYESLTNMDVNMQPNTDGMIIKQYEIQTHHNNQHLLHPLQQSQENLEANNNLPQQMRAKNQLSSSRDGRLSAKTPKSKRISVITKEHQVTSTNTGSHYISENGFHKCIECDKFFNKACYLTQHNKSFHSGDKPFKCNQCGKRFPLEYQHAEHLQKHAGDKPYKCEICPKQFNHKTDLRRHMCLHTGEKPYACDTCGKGFIRKDHMMKHYETHKKKNNNNNYNVHLRT